MWWHLALLHHDMHVGVFFCALTCCLFAMLQSYNRLMVSEHGRVTGRDAMMAEIQARGPISCGIDATLKLDGYEGGCAWDAAPLPALKTWKRIVTDV